MFVIMAQDVADAGDLRPRNIGVALFHVLGHVAACFGDDLDAAFDNPLIQPIGFEILQGKIAEQDA